MLKKYVDFGRLVTEEQSKGAGNNLERDEIKYTEEQLEKDENNGETVDNRMKRLPLPIMNNINPDLEWKIELEDFITEFDTDEYNTDRDSTGESEARTGGEEYQRLTLGRESTEI